MPIFFSLFSFRNAHEASPERVLELLVLQHRRGDTNVHPEELLRRVGLLRHRHAMGAREHAHEHVDFLLTDQSLGLGDRDLGLRLGIGVDRTDAIAVDAALLVDHVDRDLVAEVRGLRAAGRERPGQIVDHADLDLLLSDCGCSEGDGNDGGRDGQATRDRAQHGNLLQETR
jgi:hypothetical protein